MSTSQPKPMFDTPSRPNDVEEFRARYIDLPTGALAARDKFIPALYDYIEKLERVVGAARLLSSGAQAGGLHLSEALDELDGKESARDM